MVSQSDSHRPECTKCCDKLVLVDPGSYAINARDRSTEQGLTQHEPQQQGPYEAGGEAYESVYQHGAHHPHKRGATPYRRSTCHQSGKATLDRAGALGNDYTLRSR